VIVVVGENILLALGFGRVMNQRVNGIHRKIGGRVELDQALLFSVENSEENVLAAHERELNCFFEQPFLPFRVGHVASEFVFNEFPAVDFLFAHF
jgi:hypothetical protein